MKMECILLFETHPRLVGGKVHNFGRGAHPILFSSSKAIYMPHGSAVALAQLDSQKLEELRAKAKERGLHGVFQVRLNLGGTCAKGKLRKALLHSGSVDTGKTGTHILIREFEV